MYQINNGTKNNLHAGNFEDVTLNKWFNNNNFEAIFAIIEGLKKKSIYYLAEFIAMYAHKNLFYPNANIWDSNYLKGFIKHYGGMPENLDLNLPSALVDEANRRIIEKSEQVLEEIIKLANMWMHQGEIAYETLLDKLSKSSSVMIRLYCCANIDNYRIFMEDEDSRVRKVANIREDYSKKLESLLSKQMYKDLNQISFIKNALEFGVIEFTDANPSGKFEKITVEFVSSLFLEEATGWIKDFDRDICYTIADKGVLAMMIWEMIRDGEITLLEDMNPNKFTEGPYLTRIDTKNN